MELKGRSSQAKLHHRTTEFRRRSGNINTVLVHNERTNEEIIDAMFSPFNIAEKEIG